MQPVSSFTRALAVASCLSACGAQPQPATSPTSPSPEPTASPPAATAATVSIGTPTLSGADRVSRGPTIQPDGTPDVEVSATISGDVAALVLAVCNEKGMPTMSQWDTIVGDAKMPAPFMHPKGSNTWVLGVHDATGAQLNAADGSLPLQRFSAPTQLTLAAANDGSIRQGARLCLWSVQPDGGMQQASTSVPMP